MNKKLLYFAISLLIICSAYFVTVQLISGTVSKTNLLGIVFLGLLFLLSTAFMVSGKNPTPEKQVQRFILGTSIQIIFLLFFVLAIRYAREKEFREFVIYFMPSFGFCLFAQAFWLLKTRIK
jgi:hypothetical protein